MDESIRQLSWQERAQACSDQIERERYFPALWKRFKPEQPFAQLEKAQALEPFQLLWEALPSIPAIRVGPFNEVCELAQEFCFGDEPNQEAAARTVAQVLENHPQAKVLLYTERPRIDDEWAKSTCKVGQGAACCRYLAMGADGWSCLKHSEHKFYIDGRVESGTMHARGDNCEGRAV